MALKVTDQIESSVWENHRDHSMHTERATMQCRDIACARSFNTGLTSAEGQKPDCFKLMPICIL